MSHNCHQDQDTHTGQQNGGAMMSDGDFGPVSDQRNGIGHLFPYIEPSPPKSKPPPPIISRRVKNVSFILVPFITMLLVLGIVALCTKSTPIPRATKMDLVDDGPQPESLMYRDHNVRLPPTVRPTHYRLELTPYLENDTVAGSVSIHVTCLTADVSNITLHAKNMLISSTFVSTIANSRAVEDGAQFLDVVQVVTDDERDFLTLVLGETLVLGQEYRLHFEFVSAIRNDMKGIYRSTYKDKGTNQTKSLVVTQFEPISARLAFPCFDEPDLKATFELSVGRMRNMSSLSNTKLNSTKPIESLPAGWIWDHYNPTPRMSTYLLAFVVSEFQFTETTFANGKKLLRVWSRPEYIKQTNYALKIAPRLVEFFQSYVGTEYPLEKLDLVGVPDFGQGAMENFGLITFKESELLLEESEAPQAVIDSVASTIAHEIAHQWFGDLVTMGWWSDLWLNEGFATYFQFIGVNYVEPTWNKMTTFHSSEVYSAFQADSLRSSHSISTHIDNPDAVNDMFDTITYSKGAAVIRMMAHFLTESTFQKGLKSYLQKWKFNSTTPDDLWHVMTEQGHADSNLDSDMSVQNIMNGWTNQLGYPVVQIERKYSSDDSSLALFTQTQFRLGRSPSEVGQVDPSSNRWWVPISFATSSFNSDFNVTDPFFWLTPDPEQYTNAFELNTTEEEWMVVNVRQTGFYRVNYDPQNWRLLATQLRTDPSAIAVENRAQIVDDAFNLAHASMIPYELAFNLASYLRNGSEPEFLPWKAFTDTMIFFRAMFGTNSPDQIESLNSYIRLILQKGLNNLGFYDQPTDTLQDVQTRMVLMASACRAGHQTCVTNSKQLFSKWMATPNKNPIPLDYRKIIYCAAIKFGGDKEWNFLLRQYLHRSVPSETKAMVHGLSCSRNAATLARLLSMALDQNSGIRRGDTASIFKEVAGANPIGTEQVVDTLASKWTAVQDYAQAVDRVLEMVGQRAKTPEALRKMESIRLQQQNVGGSGSDTRALNQAIERIRLNIKWMDDHSDEVAQLLRDDGLSPGFSLDVKNNEKHYNEVELGGTETDNMLLLQ